MLVKFGGQHGCCWWPGTNLAPGHQQHPWWFDWIHVLSMQNRHQIITNQHAKDLIDGLVQDCSNSIANALELLQSCNKPSMYGIHLPHIIHPMFHNINILLQILNHLRLGQVGRSEFRVIFQYKTIFPSTRIPTRKIRWSWNHIIFVMEISILVRYHLYTEMASRVFFQAEDSQHIITHITRLLTMLMKRNMEYSQQTWKYQHEVKECFKCNVQYQYCLPTHKLPWWPQAGYNGVINTCCWNDKFWCT